MPLYLAATPDRLTRARAVTPRLAHVAYRLGPGSELLAAPPELVVLPGGMPGTTNLAKSPAVEALVRRTLEHGGRAAAICAAPSVLAQYGLLAGRRATCYPGFENRCTGAHMVDADVVTDGPITTGRALGAAMAFALELVRLLTDEQTAARTAEEIVWRT